MESLYGAGTNPVPYMMLAYGIGALSLLGVAAWIVIDRMRLRRLSAAISPTSDVATRH